MDNRILTYGLLLDKAFRVRQVRWETLPKESKLGQLEFGRLKSINISAQ